jgi:hypothetical protein
MGKGRDGRAGRECRDQFESSSMDGWKLCWVSRGRSSFFDCLRFLIRLSIIRVAPRRVMNEVVIVITTSQSGRVHSQQGNGGLTSYFCGIGEHTLERTCFIYVVKSS